MRVPPFKAARVAAALVIGTGLAAAFADFRPALPPSAGHAFASLQGVPAMLALATGTSLGLGALLALVLTLAAGRIYCSALCPLGILQDGVIRLGQVRRGRTPSRPFHPGHPRLRIGVLAGALVLIAAGFGGVVFAWLDPYSLFGRIGSGLLRPVAAVLNNTLVDAGAAFGCDVLFRVPPPWAGGASAVAAGFLAILAWVAIRRGRLYCNTLCPVGTLLGLVATRSAWQLRIDGARCRNCGDCLRVCKAECIDLRHGMIDPARCVACGNCLGACHEQGIAYHFTWRRPAAAPAPRAAKAADAPAGPAEDRRAFLGALAGSVAVAWTGAPGIAPGTASAAIAPPGAGSVDRFVARCTACHLCVSACPTHVLQPAGLEYGWAGLFKPHLVYAASFCNFDCRRCAEACPDGALDLLDLARKQVTRIGAARLDLDQCIVKQHHTDCAACSEHCPTKAVDTVPFEDNLRLPRVADELCIGCGACEYACPAQPRKAITVTGRRRHETAVRRIEPKAQDPRRGEDFPF